MEAVTKKPCPPMVGADVEAFLYDLDNSKYVPCVGLVKGTKERPLQMAHMPKGFCLQEDNVMLEFNIPPAENYTKFHNNMAAIKKTARNFFLDRGKNYELTFTSSLNFSADDLTSEQAQKIGCEPDFDAYQGGDIRTSPPKLTSWRNAGGHIHIGGDFQCPDFVAALFADLFIGLFGRIVGFDSTNRANWYGAPGIYRPKPYGIEYRTPGSEWAGDKSSIMNTGSYAVRLAKFLTESDAKDLQTIFRGINWADVRSALTYNPAMTGNEREDFRVNVMSMAQKAGAPL